MEGYGSDLPVGTVVLDVDKDAWQRTHSGMWELAGGTDDLRETLSSRWAPYTIIYTPKGGIVTPWEMLMDGNDEIIPIQVIDFDADLIAAYLDPACRNSRNPSENARI